MKIFKIVCIIVMILGVATFAYSAEAKRTAHITSLEGTASVKLAGASNWSQAKVGEVLNEGDALKTDAGSKVLVTIGDKGQVGIVEVSENSQMLLAEMMVNEKESTSKTLLDLAMGDVLIHAQKVHGEQSKFEVKTPTSIVGVRGTTFRVKVEAVE